MKMALRPGACKVLLRPGAHCGQKCCVSLWKMTTIALGAGACEARREPEGRPHLDALGGASGMALGPCARRIPRRPGKHAQHIFIKSVLARVAI